MKLISIFSVTVDKWKCIDLTRFYADYIIVMYRFIQDI